MIQCTMACYDSAMTLAELNNNLCICLRMGNGICKFDAKAPIMMALQCVATMKPHACGRYCVCFQHNRNGPDWKFMPIALLGALPSLLTADRYVIKPSPHCGHLPIQRCQLRPTRNVGLTGSCFRLREKSSFRYTGNAYTG